MLGVLNAGFFVDLRSLLMGWVLACFCTSGSAAISSVEIEPNDTIATASLTYGAMHLAILGTLGSATDQDFFSFVVAKLGVQDIPFSTAVRISVTVNPHDYRLAVIDTFGNVIISADAAYPLTIDFNPTALAGTGTYFIQIAALSGSSVGPYRISVMGVADGKGRPPVIIGSGSVNTVVEYQNIEDFPGSPGGHFFYTADPEEMAVVDDGTDGRFVLTGKTFKSGGTKQLCRFYGSVMPGPNSHFYTISDTECGALKAMQRVPTPTNVQQWNYEGFVFSETPPQIAGSVADCMAGTIPVYRGYNNAYPSAGPKNTWDSAHRYSVDRGDIQQLVAQFGWVDEGIVFCAHP